MALTLSLQKGKNNSHFNSELRRHACTQKHIDTLQYYFLVRFTKISVKSIFLLFSF